MRSLFHRLLAVACMAFMLASCGGHDDDVPLVRSTILSSDEQLPPNISTALASGTVTIDWDSDVLIASVYVSDVTPTEVHLHHAPAGSIGLQVLPLQRLGDTGLWQGSVAITDEQFRALRYGNFYFDLHSLAYPAGELRGQLFSAFPPQEHVAAIVQAAPGSALMSEQLRQLDEYEDWWHGSGSGVGLGLSFGF